VIAALLAALMLAQGGAAPPAAIQPVSINIVDAPRPQEKWGFAPSARRVEPGTWITWSNAGGDSHSVTSVDGAFDSGELQPSEGFSWYFDQPGTYAYVCTLHPWMAGKIVVTSSPQSAVNGQQSPVGDQTPTLSDQQSSVSEQPLPTDEPLPDT
jgi:plastocyanin